MLNSLLSGCLFMTTFMIVSPGAVAQDSSRVWIQDVEMPQYFAVLVDEVDEVAAWYSTVFGVNELDRMQAEDGSWQIVNLKNENFFIEIIRVNQSQKVERAQGFFKVGFQVPDVERVADRVEQEVGERPRIIDDARHQVRILQLKDPAGNTIQLHAPLSP